jgi:hypothetical protein
MAATGKIRFQTRFLSRLRFDLTCHVPDLAARPLALTFRFNGKPAGSMQLVQNGWTKAEVDLRGLVEVEGPSGIIEAELEIRADRTWQPSATNPQSQDDRELSIAVCNIEVFG